MALCRRLAPAVATSNEGPLVNGQFKTGILRQPGGDLGEDRDEVVGRFVAVPEDGEVQVLGESVGLEVALPQTGPTLESPTLQLRLGGDARQQPPEGPVLLDDVAAKLPLVSEGEGFRATGSRGVQLV